MYGLHFLTYKCKMPWKDWIGLKLNLVPARGQLDGVDIFSLPTSCFPLATIHPIASHRMLKIPLAFTDFRRLYRQHDVWLSIIRCI